MAEAARVLHVVGGMARGGAETMIMNLYRQVNRDRLQFDFLCTRDGEQSYDAEIVSLGGRIIHIQGPSAAGYPSYLRQMRQAIDQYGPFRAVHAHTLFNTGPVCAVAKSAGVPVRVSHSHSTSDMANASFAGRLYSMMMRPLIRYAATDLVACGEEAGRYLFGARAWQAGRVSVLQNGVDLNAYSDLERVAVVEEYSREFGFARDDVVLGHVAGFRKLKNHAFLVQLMKKLRCAERQYKLLLVGDGETRPEIEGMVQQLGLQDRVVFAGVRADIPALMTYFDVFLLPSLYEGLPVTVVEAQAAGTPCVLSDVVTREVDLGLGLIEWVSLDDMDGWAAALGRALQIARPSFEARADALGRQGYDVAANADALYAIYGV